ncbi:MAG TPA: hypothetical protein VKP67_00935 [Xanthobacteraceae bacterium]|nr:hypothetical protein [Xanthobacteraceae bacterium]
MFSRNPTSDAARERSLAMLWSHQRAATEAAAARATVQNRPAFRRPTTPGEIAARAIETGAAAVQQRQHATAQFILAAAAKCGLVDPPEVIASRRVREPEPIDHTGRPLTNPTALLIVRADRKRRNVL